MNAEILIFGEKVYGIDIDAQTRCAHWHGELDIIAIKFKCCGRYYPCYECHSALETHQPEVWAESEFETEAVLCGVCGYRLSVDEYLACDSVCPHCESKFNPGCARHYHLYFEDSAKKQNLTNLNRRDAEKKPLFVNSKQMEKCEKKLHSLQKNSPPLRLGGE